MTMISISRIKSADSSAVSEVPTRFYALSKLLPTILTSCVSVSAQGVPFLEKGQVNVIGFGLSAFASSLGGVTLTSTGVALGNGPFTLGAPSSNGGGGIRLDFSLARRIRLYGEWAYIGGSHDTFNQIYILAGSPPTANQVTLSEHSSFQQITGGMEWLIPIRASLRIVPYVNVGFGGIALGGGVNASVVGAPTPGSIFSSTIPGRRFVVTTGAGFSYYFTERAGLRLGIDGIIGPQARSTNGSTGSNVVTPNGATHLGRFVYGFFYQIH
jgi:hypothetical protein